MKGIEYYRQMVLGHLALRNLAMVNIKTILNQADPATIQTVIESLIADGSIEEVYSESIGYTYYRLNQSGSKAKTIAPAPTCVEHQFGQRGRKRPTELWDKIVKTAIEWHKEGRIFSAADLCRHFGKATSYIQNNPELRKLVRPYVAPNAHNTRINERNKRRAIEFAKQFPNQYTYRQISLKLKLAESFFRMYPDARSAVAPYVKKSKGKSK